MRVTRLKNKAAKLLSVDASLGNTFLGIFAALSLSATLLIGLITPPFQSPDEMAHFTKSAMLSNGQILPEKAQSGKSVGYVDSGVLEYMQLFTQIPFHPEKKIDEITLQASREIKFSGKLIASETAGLSTYFPGLYAPGALVISAGTALGWTVDFTYRLTKAFSALFYSALLFLCLLKLKRFELMFLGVLSLPMTLFQIASPTLDGPTIVIAILASQLLLSQGEGGERNKKLLTLSFWLYLLVVLTRPYLVVLLALPILFSQKGALRKYLLKLSLVGIAILAAWYAISAKTYDKTFQINPEPGATVLHFLANPLEFIQLLITTILDPIMGTFIATSFIGNLGWLDMPFSIGQYLVLGCLSMGLLVFQLIWARPTKFNKPDALTLAVLIISVVSVFASMLATWTPQPARIIEGVQGRYLLVPAVVFALFIGSLNRNRSSNISNAFSWIFIFVTMFLGTTFTIVRLVERYYMQ